MGGMEINQIIWLKAIQVGDDALLTTGEVGGGGGNFVLVYVALV